MIVLKILLWILFVILCIIVAVFLIPIGGKVEFIGGKFSFEVFASFIPVMNSQKKGILDRLMKKKKPRKSDDDAVDDLPDADYGTDEGSDEEILSDKKEDDVSQDSETAHPVENPDEITELSPDEVEIVGEDDDEETEEELTEEDEEKPVTENKKKKRKKAPKTIGEKLEFIIDIWRAADRPLLKIFKGFRFSDVYIDFIAANEDAYNCALMYGAVSGTVYNLLAFIGTVFTVKFRTVDINAGFGLRESRWDASLKLDFRLGTLVIAGVWFLITYIFRILIPNALNKNKLKKSQNDLK